MFEKITNSFEIFHVSFQDIKDRNPILASRFYIDIKTFMLNKLIFKIIEVKVKSREVFLNILSDTNGSNNKMLVNIKTSSNKMMDFKHKKIFSIKEKSY